MGLSFLTPLFLAGFVAVAVPIIIHLIRRHRGKVVRFPSLMFLRQLPVQSVRRRTIRDWPLLLLRVGALVLIALAFARPVLRLGGAENGLTQDALRESVIVLDRSWSMDRGDRWDRAVAEARATLNSLVTPDRASLVLFDGVGSVVVEPTLDPGRVSAALDTIRPGWGSTQIGAGLQAASGILQASDRTQREVVLISDFQRRGWEDGPRDPLPEGTRFITRDVGDDGLGSMIVSDVTLEHSFAENRQRVRPIARVVRQGETAPTRARIALDIDGQETDVRDVELTSEGATTVAFDPITLPDEGMRGAVTLAPEGGETLEPFRFVVSPSEILSVLLVEGGRGRSAAPYLRSALTVAGGQPIRVETRSDGAISSADLQGTDLVILNDVPLPSGASGSLLRDHISAGGGLLVITGPESDPGGWDAAWDDYLPGRVGDVVDRDPSTAASLAQIDRDHPIFTAFQGIAGSGLGTPRFFRYRELEVPAAPTPESGEAPTADDRQPRVLARFDDGAPALAQRVVGGGRVLLWTSTLDNNWSDFPLHPVFLPLVRESIQFAAGTRERVPYFTVGQPLDSHFLLVEAGLVRDGDEAPAASSSAPEAGGGLVVGPTAPPIARLVAPDGTATDLTGEAGELVKLASPGFYEVREASDDAGEGWVLAVNPDVQEADPSRIDPEELTLAVAPGSVAASEGEVQAGTEAGDLSEGTDAQTLLEEGERRQGAWRFLLAGALLLLVGEAVLASRRKPLAKQA